MGREYDDNQSLQQKIINGELDLAKVKYHLVLKICRALRIDFL